MYPEKPYCDAYQNLRNAYQRNAVFKLVMQRLVMKYLHCQPGTDTASDGSQPQKRGFTNAPFSLFGLQLVETVNNKCNRINDDEVDDNDE